MRRDSILEFVADGKERFLTDRMVRDAVLRNLHTLSESAQKLPDDLKAFRPEIDWRGVSAFRNVVVHDYLGIDEEMVWRVVERELPPLRQAVLSLLSRIYLRSFRSTGAINSITGRSSTRARVSRVCSEGWRMPRSINEM